jgi:hypothetical protein
VFGTRIDFPTFPAEEPIDIMEVERIEGTVRLFDSEGNIRKVPVPYKDPADALTRSSWITNFEDPGFTIFEDETATTDDINPGFTIFEDETATMDDINPGFTIFEDETATMDDINSGFTIFEDETATMDDITRIEDENFAIALGDAHEYVEAYIQCAMLSYCKKLTDYLAPLAKMVGEVVPGEEATPLEKQLLQWKHDKQLIFVAAAGGTKWKDTRGKEWFTAEYVEELVELLEVMVGEGASVRILAREDDTEGELETWKERAFWICGYCQGEGIEGVKRKGMEHYARMGTAWKRIVDRQFADNIWDQSQERVWEWRWHCKMMLKIVYSEGWTNYAEVLKARWMVPTNHPHGACQP